MLHCIHCLSTAHNHQLGFESSFVADGSKMMVVLGSSRADFAFSHNLLLVKDSFTRLRNFISRQMKWKTFFKSNFSMISLYSTNSLISHYSVAESEVENKHLCSKGFYELHLFLFSDSKSIFLVCDLLSFGIHVLVFLFVCFFNVCRQNAHPLH